MQTFLTSLKQLRETRLLEFEESLYLSQVSKVSQNSNLENRNKFKFINNSISKPDNRSLQKRRNRGIVSGFWALGNWSFRVCLGFRILRFEFGPLAALKCCLPRWICLLAGLWLGLISAPAATTPTPQSGFSYPPALSLNEVRERIDQSSTEHPRLLVNKEGLALMRKSLARDPLSQAIADAVIRDADLILTQSPIKRELQGRRLLGKSRTCVQRVVTLSMSYHLTNDDKYVRRCNDEMLAAARFRDWNPSHFLDVAEMTFALAVGYDWLFDQLDEASRTEIRHAIVSKGVSLPFETRHKSWVRAENNWGQVCHGGLTAGALAIMEHEPGLASRTVHNALHNVTPSMAAYAPKGSYPEGPGYWSYGTSYNVLLIGVLESVMGTDFGLSKAPGFSATGQYLSLTCGPSGQFFNYADGGAGRSPQPVLFWFASRFGRPDWLLGERELLQDRIIRKSSNSRFFPFTLLWINKAPETSEIQMPLHWHGEGETPITVHRSSWTDSNAVFFGLKAGSPSANHGQMDTGSFVLDADGVRWALDLGAEGYHGIESRGMNLWSRAQDSDRWTIFRQQNHGHNTLVIDGQLQRAQGKATVISFSSDPAFPHTVVDLSSVYEGQAGSVQRGMALLPSGEIIIQDKLTGLKPGSRVRWGMITPGKPGPLDSQRLHLRQGNASIALTIHSLDNNYTWQVIDTAKPRNEWDSPNSGTRMAGFNAMAPASGNLTFAVLVTPGSCRQSVMNTLRLRPLTNW